MDKLTIELKLREAMSPEDYKKYLSDKKIYPDCEKHILVNVASDGTIKKSLLDATGKIIK